MSDVTDLSPPDDTGSVTFARYRYQARVAVRYVMACAGGTSVIAVIPEHFEDLAVQLAETAWHFVQIKTRELSLGPWRLSDVLGADGAFRSLARTCNALPVDELDVLFIASLEGAIATGDGLACFVGGECNDRSVVDRVTDRLGLSAEQAARLIPRLRVTPESPRSAIDAMNIRRLGTCMADKTHQAVEEAYERTLSLIQRAMEAELLGDDWALRIVEPDERGPATGKRIDRTMLDWLTQEMTAGSTPLLSRLLTTDQWPASQLEEKLLAGGATAEVIADAIQVRAMADRYILEREAASIWADTELIQDLDIRLTLLARASVARHADDASPANGAWSHMHERLSVEAAIHDPRGLLGRDPILLLGRACSLSDQCDFDWRATNA